MLDVIRNRRSIRKFKSDPVDDATVDRVIEMGTWAPSGLNNQPWKFVVVRDADLREKLGRQTKYGHIIRSAPLCIAVFLDEAESYNRIKDIQAVGACIQNMLLAIHHLDLGAVWLGEILNQREAVEKLLGVPESCELMAVVALGRPGESWPGGSRRPMEEVILARK